MGNSKAKRLRELIARPGAFLVPIVYDALTAKYAERAGFEAVFMSGSGVAAALGQPDLGIITLTEAATQARYMANAVNIPLVCDCDTGYGNSLSAARTVQEFEMNGVAGIMIQDQTPLKRRVQVGGTSVIPRDQFVGKIKAAVRARRDPDIVIIARTDASTSLGFQEVIDRANACVAVGADVVYVVGEATAEERRDAPKLIRAPLVGSGDLTTVESEGYKLGLTAQVQNVLRKVLTEYFAEVKARGGTSQLRDREEAWGDFEGLMRTQEMIRQAVEEYNEPEFVNETG
jgi:2-methylisocitrate lyase-like PEP mutase family enzyme